MMIAFRTINNFGGRGKDRKGEREGFWGPTNILILELGTGFLSVFPL